MSSPQWTWDPHRQDYCYWSDYENCFIYGKGDKVYVQAQAQGVNQHQPQQSPGWISTAQPVAAYDPRTSYVPQNLSTYPSHNRNDSQQSGYYETASEVTSQFQQPNLSSQGQPNVPSSQPYYPQTPPAPQSNAANYGSSVGGYPATRPAYSRPRAIKTPKGVLERDVQEQPKQDITDPDFYARGVQANLKLKGNESFPVEHLDKRYKIQPNGDDFFQVGKVFKVLWPELAGDKQDGATIFTATFNAKVHAKVRWFAVIKQGHLSCSCLPIQTYGNRGVAARKTIKGDHAIIYTGKSPPSPNKDEMPSKNEEPMRQPIRVKPIKESYKLNRMSRLNYGKVYTVEHNVKVMDFGAVHKKSIHVFIHSFNARWRIEAPTAGNDSSSSDEEENEGDAGESEQEEVYSEQAPEYTTYSGYGYQTYRGHEPGEGSGTNNHED